ALRDLDGDGRCELLFTHGKASAVFRWSDGDQVWKPLPFSLPAPGSLSYRDHAGSARLIDLDGDGKLDFIFSNETGYGVSLFRDMKAGGGRKVMAGKRGDADALPMIAHNDTNYGFWVHSGHLWWSNEDTPLLKDHVDRRSIKKLLGDE